MGCGKSPPKLAVSIPGGNTCVFLCMLMTPFSVQLGEEAEEMPLPACTVCDGAQGREGRADEASRGSCCVFGAAFKT